MFDDVDRVALGEQARLVAMMAATDAWPGVVAARAWVLDQVALDAAGVVLDVGCGPGTFGRLARSRGATSIDVDRSAAMLAALGARDRRSAVQGDLVALPVRAGAVGLAHVERVLQWMPDPRAALDELCRVIAPGGVVAVTDTDWGTFTVDHPDPAVAASLQAGALAWVAHPTLARGVGRHLRDRGLADVAVRADAVVIGAWDPDDPDQRDGPPGLPLRTIAAAVPAADRSAAAEAVDALAEQARAGRFAAGLTIVTSVGRRPG